MACFLLGFSGQKWGFMWAPPCSLAQQSADGTFQESAFVDAFNPLAPWAPVYSPVTWGGGYTRGSLRLGYFQVPHSIASPNTFPAWGGCRDGVSGGRLGLWIRTAHQDRVRRTPSQRAWVCLQAASPRTWENVPLALLSRNGSKDSAHLGVVVWLNALFDPSRNFATTLAIPSH